MYTFGKEMFKIVFWVFVAIAASAAQAPCIKYYTKTKEICWIYYALLASAVLTFSYSQLFSDYDIESIYPFIKILSIMVVVVLSVLLFKTKVSTNTILGLFFGGISLVLLSSNIRR